MDGSTAVFLLQDGLTTGAIYALVALALVLAFAVTRVIFVGQGDYVVYGALTLATLQSGLVPPTLWLLNGCSIAAWLLDCHNALRTGQTSKLPGITLACLLPALLITSPFLLVSVGDLPQSMRLLLTLAIVTALGPLVYRLIYQRIAQTTVLHLLIVSVALHMVLLGLSLWMFGAEGYRAMALSERMLAMDTLTISVQSLVIVITALSVIAALFVFFNHSLYGKALRATAFNRQGAQLMGIPINMTGKATFALAAFIGASSGILISPLTTLYYDSGFLISLKGFVAAIIGGLASYPLAAAGALVVGLLESFSMFWASAYKEVIVFTLVIPVLLMLSLKHPSTGDEHQ